MLASSKILADYLGIETYVPTIQPQGGELKKT